MVEHTVGKNAAFGEGVPTAYLWRNQGAMGYGNDPHGLVQIAPWGVIFRADGNPPSDDVLIKVGDLSLDVLSAGVWNRWSFLKRVEGEIFVSAFAGEPIVHPLLNSSDPNCIITRVHLSDHAFHFYVPRVPIAGRSIDGIVVSYTAKLVSRTGADVSGQAGTYLGQTGCDFKTDDGVVVQHAFVGRMTPLTTSLRRFYGTTMTAAELSASMPPGLAQLTQTDPVGIDPDYTP